MKQIKKRKYLRKSIPITCAYTDLNTQCYYIEITTECDSADFLFFLPILFLINANSNKQINYEDWNVCVCAHTFLSKLVLIKIWKYSRRGHDCRIIMDLLFGNVWLPQNPLKNFFNSKSFAYKQNPVSHLFSKQ